MQNIRRSWVASKASEGLKFRRGLFVGNEKEHVSLTNEN